MGRKLGALSPFWGGGAGSESHTMSFGSRPTFLPSGILIHPTIWPQQISAQNWGLCPLGEVDLGPHLTQCDQGRGLYLHAKFHLDPSNRLATIHQRHRQDRTGMTDNDPTAYGEPFYKRSPKSGSPYAIGPLSVLSSLSVCDVGVLWLNDWTD